MATEQTGATWPDVALATISFAREEPIVFVGVLLGVLLPTAFIVWFLLPRASTVAERLLDDELKRHERQLKLPMPEKDDQE